MLPKKAGRPPVKISDEKKEEIKLLAGFGLRQADIAIVVKISESTLERHCKDLMYEGRQTAIANVAKSLYQNAISGNVAAQIFYLKAQAGWREPQAVEHTGKDGEPLTINLVHYSALKK